MGQYCAPQEKELIEAEPTSGTAIYAPFYTRSVTRKFGSLNGNGTNDETVDWLNFFVAELWPKLEAYVETMIKGLEPKFNAAIPIPGVDCQIAKASLGPVPPTFDSISTRSVGGLCDGKFSERNGVELSLGMNFISDIDVDMKLRGAWGDLPIGVEDLKISGEVSVLLRPLIPDPPLIGGYEIVCLNPPKVDLKFTGALKVLGVKGIKSALRKVIDDAIGDVLVVPNRIAVALIKDTLKVDLARLKCPTPLCMVRITIHSAANLPNTDWIGHSDPYVVARLGRYNRRTPSISGSQNPKWTEGNVLNVLAYSGEQLLKLEVYDCDQSIGLERDDLLGQTELMLCDLVSKVGAGPMNLKLKEGCAKFTKGKEAHLCISLDVFLLHQTNGVCDAAVGPNDFGEYVFSVMINEIFGLPETNMMTPYNIRVKVDTPVYKEEAEVQSKPSYAKESAVASATEDMLVRLRKLKNHDVPISVMADVMTLDEDLVKEMLAAPIPGASSAGPVSANSNATNMVDEKLLTKVTQDRSKRAEMTNPQFEEVIRILLKSPPTTVTLELLDSKGKVIAYVNPLPKSRDSKWPIAGPFNFMDASTKAPMKAKEDGATDLQVGHAANLVYMRGELRLTRMTAASGEVLENNFVDLKGYSR